MKKLTALLLSALLCLSLLAGCQQGEEEAKNPTCEEVLTAIQEAIGEDNLPMMGEIDDETLSVCTALNRPCCSRTTAARFRR